MNCEEYALWAQKLNPIDDDLFKKMAEDSEFCQEIIRVILGDLELQVVELKDQHSVKNLQGRSVILDALCVDHLGEYVTVEVQKQLILMQYREGVFTLQKACTYLKISEEQFLELEKNN